MTYVFVKYFCFTLEFDFETHQIQNYSPLMVSCVQVEKILGGGKQSRSAVDLVRTPQMRRALILFYIW